MITVCLLFAFFSIHHFIFTKSKYHQNEEYQQTVTKSRQFWRQSRYIGMPNFRPLMPCLLQEIRKPQHWTISQSQMPPKLLRSTDRDQNLIMWPEYISIPNSRPFPQAFSRKCTKTLNLTHFTKFFPLCDLEIWHMTLKFWRPQAVSVSNHLMKY